MKFELFTAFRYLRSKKDNLFISKLLFISILTVSMAISVPIIVLSIVNGFHNGIKDKVIGSDFHLRVSDPENNFKSYMGAYKKIKTHKDVELAVPFFESEGLIKSRQNSNYTYVTVKAFYDDQILKSSYFTKNFKIIDSIDNHYNEIDKDDDLDDHNESSGSEKSSGPNNDNKDDSIDSDNSADTENSNSNLKNNSDDIKELISQINKGKLDSLENKSLSEIIKRSNSQITPPIDESKLNIPFRIDSVNDIILGDAISNTLQVKFGDTIDVVLPRDIDLDIEAKSLRFTKKYSAGYAKFNKGLVFIHFKSIKEIFQFNGLPTHIGINLKEGHSTKDFILFMKTHFPKLIVTNTFEEGIFKDFAQEKKLMTMLLLFLTISAFITIYISVHVVVIDKRKEIGILKTFGSMSQSIQSIFVLEGIIISFTGVIIGNLLGVLITVSITEIIIFIEWIVNTLWKFAEDGHLLYKGDQMWWIMDPNVFYLKTFPYKIDYFDVFLLCAGAIFVSIIAAYLPSKQASEKNVVESLRF